MRRLLLVILSVLAVQSTLDRAVASTIFLPLNGSVTLVGDIPSPTQISIQLIVIDLVFSVVADNTMPGFDVPSSIIVSAFVSSDLGRSASLSYFDNHCGHSLFCTSHTAFATSDNLLISDEFRVLTVQSYISLIGPVTANYEIRAFLPDGIEAAVPEPSTWAMLLLGFAGISFLAYRKSKMSRASLNRRDHGPTATAPMQAAKG